MKEKQELTPEYIKSLTMLWSTKEYNEHSDEELKQLEEVMIKGVEGKDES